MVELTDKQLDMGDSAKFNGRPAALRLGVGYRRPAGLRAGRCAPR
jgi:hypothetical protein